jgi:small subunit ribosomal protein S9
LPKDILRNCFFEGDLKRRRKTVGEKGGGKKTKSLQAGEKFCANHALSIGAGESFPVNFPFLHVTILAPLEFGRQTLQNTSSNRTCQSILEASPTGPVASLFDWTAISRDIRSMAWQRSSCLAQTVQGVCRAAQWHPSLQSSVHTSPLTSISTRLLQQKRRRNPFSTSARRSETEVIKAAPEIDFSKFNSSPARIVPASPAYFSASPKFIDHLLNLERILAKYASLPTVAPSEAPRMAWFKLAQFRDFVGENVPTKKYKNLVKILQRLNRIDPALVPEEVRETLGKFLRPGNPYANKPAPAMVDEMGRARGKGKRKTSSAVAYLVEGEGEVLVNDKNLVDAFPRVHDRESALWALRCTQRLDKYNVWARVHGGGTTGQAEAISLAVARALLVHEPALKPVLRKGMTSLPCPSVMLVVYFASLVESEKRILANYCFTPDSWGRHGRCASRGEEEAWSSESKEDASLGQEMIRAFTHAPFSSFTMYFHVCYFDSEPILYITMSLIYSRLRSRRFSISRACIAMRCCQTGVIIKVHLRKLIAWSIP